MTDDELQTVQIKRHKFHGEWNYTIRQINCSSHSDASPKNTPQALNSTSVAITTAGSAANRSAGQFGRLTTSVELLSRIVFTQAVIKGLRLTETAMVDAAGRAAELEVALARIRTVAGDQPLGDIATAVRDQSKALGIDQLTVAGGLYQALQNQIGKTRTELLDFNRTASQFAIGTLTQQNTAVELLSGTMNAYGVDLSRADEFASKFNRTIELGNVEGSELANVFGRVATRAATAGVTFDELNGLFATLTIRGIKASEAATQISGILTAFAKPSEDMKRALERLSVPSGEFLLRSAGLAEALRQVKDTTDGSSAALAKLFPNVRGLNGEIIVTSDNVKLLNQNIAAIKSTADTLNGERFKIIFETDAKRVERELNEVTIATTEVGRELLHATAEGLKFVGGAESIIRVAKDVAPAIVAVTAATAAWVATTRLAVLQRTAYASALTALSKVGLGVGVALSIGNLIGDKIDSSRFEALTRLEAANDRTIATFIKGEQSRLTAARTTDSAITQSALDASRQQVRAFTAANNQLIADEKRLVSVVGDELQRNIANHEAAARAYEQAAEQSARAIEQSQQRVTNLTQTKSDRKFDASTRDLSDPAKISAELTRASGLAVNAARDLSKAQTDDQIQAANRLFDAAERSAQAAHSLAQQTGNRSAENTAAVALNRLTDQRISAERTLQQLRNSRLNTLNAEATKQRQLTDSVKASAKELADNLPTIGLDPSEQAQRAANRQAAIQKILAAGFDKGDVNLTDALGLAKLAQDMERNPLPISFDVEAAVRELTIGVQRNLDTFKFNVKSDTAGLEKALGTTFSSPDEAAAGLAKAVTEADALRTSLSKVSQDRVAATTGVADEIRALVDDTKSLTNSASRAAGSFLGISLADVTQGTQLIREANAEFLRLSQSATITRDQVAAVFGKVEQLQQIQQTMLGSGSGGGFAPDIEAYSRIAEKLLQVANLPAVDPQQAARLQQLETVIAGSRDAATTIETSLTRGADRLASVLNAAADRFSAALGSVPTVNKAAGGLAYHAGGGLARGSDTVPAMLTRGETVMTAQASQRFYSDFQRMNAKMLPTYRNGGGEVHNTTVGDINVYESKNGTATAKAVDQMLRRAKRKGTIRK